MKFSGIKYCLFICTLVNRLHFVKILGYLFNQEIFSGSINAYYLDTSVFLKKTFDMGKSQTHSQQLLMLGKLTYVKFFKLYLCL